MTAFGRRKPVPAVKIAASISPRSDEIPPAKLLSHSRTAWQFSHKLHNNNSLPPLTSTTVLTLPGFCNIPPPSLSLTRKHPTPRVKDPLIGAYIQFAIVRWRRISGDLSAGEIFPAFRSLFEDSTIPAVLVVSGGRDLIQQYPTRTNTFPTNICSDNVTCIVPGFIAFRVFNFPTTRMNRRRVPGSLGTTYFSTSLMQK
jgi:hypothetical protein